jgi:outer membrane protein assembly factor BamB
MFEFKIPLALLQTSEGDTLGLAFDGLLRDGMSGWQWPVHQVAAGSRPLGDYGNIVLASYKSLWDSVHDAKGTVRWLGPHAVSANIKTSRNLDPDSLDVICGVCTEIGGELDDPRQDGWLLAELETSPEKFEYYAVTLQAHARADFWPMAGHDPAHMGRSISTVPPNNSTRWNYTAAGAIQFSPAVADEMVFLGSPTEMRALNATTGDPIWQYTRTVTSSPAVANGRVFFGAADGLYALNETTGIPAWRFQTTAPVNSSPIVTAGIVVFGCDDHYVYALNETDKSVIWSYAADGPVRTSPNNPPHGLADPRPTPLVIFGSATTMYAVNMTTGAHIWSYSPYPYGQVTSSPTTADGLVFFGATNGLYALNATTGTLKWQFSTSGFAVQSSPAVADGMVFFGCNDHYIRALNATTKAVMWSVNVGEEIKAAPIVAGERVIWGYSWTKGECRDRDTGELAWEFRASGDIDASPVLAYGNVFFGDLNGKLYSVGPEYNVASISLESTKTVVGENRNVFMNATVTNLGEVTETFHVGIECEEGMIGEIPVTLAPLESTVVRFRWNATYITKGNYTLRALVDTVPGETDGTDNTVSGGWIVVTILGDVDGDFDVDILDVVKITGCYGKTREDPIFYQNADIDENGVINILDLVVCTGHYGQTWP